MESLNKDEFFRLSPEDQKEYLSLLKKLEETRKYNKIDYFQPYPFQKKFYDLGATQKVRALIAANRCGKTFSAAAEITYHLTGLYPDWWEGHRFDRPVTVVAAGVTSHQVKRVLQQEFLGTMHRDRTEEIGSGFIPKHLFERSRSVGGRDGLMPEIAVKHSDGGYSTLILVAYAQDVESMMGFTADVVYVDEQDKNKFDLIFSELVKRTSSVKGLAMATFTPLNGMTHIVRQFWDPTGDFHGGLVNAGWDDIEHLDEDVKRDMLAATPPYLRDAVTKGIPVLGAGSVFNIGEEDIAYMGVEIQDEWPRLGALDIGFTNDPTAGIFAAKDPSTGIYYIYDEYGEIDNNTMAPSQHVGGIHRKGGNWIPMVYDSAASARTGASGASVADMYREMGINMLPDSFKNPKAMRQENRSYKAVLPGLVRMQELMLGGKLKVHAKNCPNWWREFRSYSYDDKGEPSAVDNHWMDASRYAIMTMERGLGQVSPYGLNYQDPTEDTGEFYFNSY